MSQRLNPRKLLLLLVTVLSVFVACFFAYKYNKLANLPIGPTSIDKTKCAPCYEYNNVGANASQLDMNLVKTMAYNYQYQNRMPAPNTNTRSVWFDIETLKNFIYQIESKTCDCNAKLGVRVYFGKYPADNTWITPFGQFLSGLRNEVMSRHKDANNNPINAYESINTIFMVPTHEIGGKNYDFDPAEPRNMAGCTFSFNGYHSKYGLADTANAPFFQNNLFGNNITALMAQNHGAACPPLPVGAAKCPDEGAYFDF